MSLLLFIFYWVIIPVSLFLITRWLFRRVTTLFQKRTVAAVSVAVFLGLLWIAAGEKWWLDYQVRELCAKDGGIKVYETVKLPAEKFNQWGQPNFYNPTKGENALGSEYTYKNENVYLHEGNPEIRRDHVRIYQKLDQKLLGEVVTYIRGGGDLPGPWQPSAYHCPNALEANEIVLMSKIFSKSIEGDKK